MNALSTGSTVLLSDDDDGPMLAAELAARSGPAVCHRDLADLLRQRPLSSISVLVIRSRPLPKGSLLATLGRMLLEYPGIQALVVTLGPPPLRIAEYLTSRGVVVTWDGEEGVRDEAERLASIVRRAQERTEWIAA